MLSPFGPVDRAFAPVPPPGRIGWLGAQPYAHRGLHGPGVPENSLAAFAGAVEAGFGIELDVQAAGDGLPVVFHDWELDRLTAETGPVARRTAGQLGTVRLTGSDQTVPTLGQVLALVNGQVPLLVEVKTRADTRVPPLCLAVRRALEGYRGPYAVIGFDPRVTRWFSVHSPLTPRGLSFTDGGALTLAGRVRRRLAFWHGRPDFITYDLTDLPNRFAAAQRRRGMALVTWTVASAEQRDRAAALADAVIAEGAGLPPETAA